MWSWCQQMDGGMTACSEVAAFVHKGVSKQLFGAIMAR